MTDGGSRNARFCSIVASCIVFYIFSSFFSHHFDVASAVSFLFCSFHFFLLVFRHFSLSSSVFSVSGSFWISSFLSNLLFFCDFFVFLFFFNFFFYCYVRLSASLFFCLSDCWFMCFSSSLCLSPLSRFRCIYVPPNCRIHQPIPTTWCWLCECAFFDVHTIHSFDPFAAIWRCSQRETDWHNLCAVCASSSFSARGNKEIIIDRSN